jgi:hypothetical protein
MHIMRADRDRDELAKERSGKTIDPPLEVLTNGGGGMSWQERTITEEAEHGFKPSETGTASWNDEGGM